jgi:hypothetical protein
MRTYQVTIEGKTPLIQHQDNIEWADRMGKWQQVAKNKVNSKAGDDRTPPFRWLGSLYHDGKHVVVPSDNIMAALMKGGTLQPTGKGQKTFKAQTQSGIMAPDLFWPVLVDGHPIPVAELLLDFEKRTFDEWNDLVTTLGFMLYVKRARIGKAKHVRVRPRFNRWTLRGSLIVTDEAITTQVLQDIGTLAGQYAGLCDWRPSSQTPGPYGMFEFSVAKG